MPLDGLPLETIGGVSSVIAACVAIARVVVIGLIKYLDSRFDQVNTRLDGLTHRLDVQNGNVARNVKKINELDTRVSVNEARIGDLHS